MTNLSIALTDFEWLVVLFVVTVACYWLAEWCYDRAQQQARRDEIQREFDEMARVEAEKARERGLSAIAQHSRWRQ